MTKTICKAEEGVNSYLFHFYKTNYQNALFCLYRFLFATVQF